MKKKKPLPVGKMITQAAKRAMKAGRAAEALHPALRGEIDPEGKEMKQITKMARVASRHSR